MFVRTAIPTSVPAPSGLEDFVVGSKLRLSLQDAVHLAVLNNTDIRANRITYDMSANGILAAHAAFDPVITSSFSPQRSVSPSITTLSGADTLSSLSQTSSAAFSQTLQSGTNLQVGFDTTRSATNSAFDFIKPAFQSSLSFSVSQPLLRNRGLLANRAPILLARRARNQSRASFEAQVSSTLANTVTQYWAVVQARENLRVVQMSLELVEKTYKQNKRALELGALPQLDIYRSEAQVAQRRVAVIQAESQLKQAQDRLRMMIGADLQTEIQALELELSDRADNAAFRDVNLESALQRALSRRSEIEAVRQALGSDDISIQVANQNLRPDLNLTGFYTSNGVGGNLRDQDTGAVVTSGGFGDSWSQLSQFKYPSYGVSLQLRLPLKNSAAAASLGNALATKQRNLYEKRRQEQAITLQVRNAFHELESNSMAIEAARAQVTAAQKNLAAEQRKYELGAQTIFFVLDAQTQLAQAEQSLLQAQIGYRNALTALDYATGELLEQYHVELSM
jgi:outer membrane protein TolC